MPTLGGVNGVLTPMPTTDTAPHALPGVFRERDADHVAPGRPQARRTGGTRRTARPQPSPHPRRSSPGGRTRVSPTRNSTRPPTRWGCARCARTARTRPTASSVHSGLPL